MDCIALVELIAHEIHDWCAARSGQERFPWGFEAIEHERLEAIDVLVDQYIPGATKLRVLLDALNQCRHARIWTCGGTRGDPDDGRGRRCVCARVLQFGDRLFRAV